MNTDVQVRGSVGPLFDEQLALEGKEDGMMRARNAGMRQALLARARLVAVEIAKQRGSVTADDVVHWYASQGIDIGSRLGNAMGSLFKGHPWRWTGEYRISDRAIGHGNRIMVWRLER